MDQAAKPGQQASGIAVIVGFVVIVGLSNPQMKPGQQAPGGEGQQDRKGLRASAKGGLDASSTAGARLVKWMYVEGGDVEEAFDPLSHIPYGQVMDDIERKEH
jgi:hypothetical protein